MKKRIVVTLALLLLLGGGLFLNRKSQRATVVVPEGVTRADRKEATSKDVPSSNGSATLAQNGGSAGGTREDSPSIPASPAVISLDSSHSDSLSSSQNSSKQSNCFSQEYRHLKEARSRDVEDFLDFTNAFRLRHQGINEKSICVKVNDKAVPFKLLKNKTQDEILIGPVVGPESVIRIAYCTGSAPCRESCTVKSNPMMDDLMSDVGNTPDEDAFKDSWDDVTGPAQAAQKKELQENVKTFRSVAGENSELSQSSVMRNWETLKTKDWFCQSEKPSRHPNPAISGGN